MKVFLCGNTGIMNRGCEAIIRSTIKLLNQKSGDVFLATFAPEQDMSLCKELGISIIPYKRSIHKFHKYLHKARKLFNPKTLTIYRHIEKPLYSRIEKGDLCLNIGGDTYCYERPEVSLALTHFTHSNSIRNILWCCSIEKEAIKGEIFADLKRYTHILAREQITFDNLLSAGLTTEHVIKACDPAFFLDKQEIDLPANFKFGNTVGINLSEVVVNNSNKKVYVNAKVLIHWILSTTNMSVCLIPHVYSVRENQNDYPILRQLYDEFHDLRVSIVDKEYNCLQLKFIISSCRFFIGARTHSTIAAYSTGVPAIAIGYSVKSKGIAMDLFGTYKDYVLAYDEIQSENELLDAFILLVEHSLITSYYFIHFVSPSEDNRVLV